MRGLWGSPVGCVAIRNQFFKIYLFESDRGRGRDTLHLWPLGPWCEPWVGGALLSASSARSLLRLWLAVPTPVLRSSLWLAFFPFSKTEFPSLLLGETECPHLLIHSPDTFTGCSWDLSKVSRVGAGAQLPEPSLPPPGSALAGSRSRSPDSEPVPPCGTQACQPALA